MKIAIACGGTGGHIFPGLATAEFLRGCGHEVDLWLTGRDIEEASLHGWEGTIISVKSTGFSSRFSPYYVVAGFQMFRCFLQCRNIMRKDKPDVVLAMGSYASVGPALAGHSLGAPVVIHEANVVPGRAILFLSRFAAAAGVTFNDTRAYLRKTKIHETGFPVRKELCLPIAKQHNRRFTILVMGGSQGAHRINEMAVEAINMLKEEGADFEVIHLCGRADEDTVRHAYEKSGITAETHAFLEDMKSAYSRANLAVCRSGASTCAELAIAGLPALLVPLSISVHGHQLANAKSMERTGAADVMEENDLSPEKLFAYIRNCMDTPEKLEEMSVAMKRRARPDAAERLANLVEQTVSA